MRRSFSMSRHSLILLLAVIAAGEGGVAAASAKKPPSPNSVLLSDVRALTLRKDAMTAHRRVPAVPQLKCIGGNARGFYEVDVMRCKNQGADYDDENIQWSCTASLPPEFKLGSTDVVCEGYTSPRDPYILKGSCGVEYRLMLTPRGEERYGSGDPWRGFKGRRRGQFNWSAAIFWLIFLSVLARIAYGFVSACRRRRGGVQGWQPGSGTGGAGGGGGDGGGGGGGGWGSGGGGGGGGNDPPPPYDYRPPPQSPPKTYPSGASQTGGQHHHGEGAGAGAGAGGQGGGRGWQPGFWTGALGGAAASYLAAAATRPGYGTQNPQPPPRQDRWSSWFGGGSGGGGGGGRHSSLWDGDNNDNDASSSWRYSSRRPPSSSSSSSFSSSRYESTGFGSTSRR